MKMPSHKFMSVLNYLTDLGLHIITIGNAIEDKALDKSYQLIQENPSITKREFLEAMGIEEYIPGPSRVRPKQK